MQRIDIDLDITGTPEPGQELGVARFFDADHSEPHRIWLRMMTPDEQEDGGAFVIEDSAGSDPQVQSIFSVAVDEFLRAVSFQIAQTKEAARARDLTRDFWGEVAEAIRGRAYGDDPDPERRARDRDAIREFLDGGERVIEDVLQPHLGDWIAYARESGYDRRRTLNLVPNGRD